MQLRTCISNTKKFFQKGLKNLKSFLSGGYQKLPKSPPFNADMNLSQSCNELDKFYTDFTNRWDKDKDKGKKRSKKKIISLPAKNEREVYCGSLTKFAKSNSIENHEVERKEEQEKKRLVHEGKRKEELRRCLVAQKLKELEMVDKSNIEHVLDIEEVLHYYSRLTCPAYVDIVDKFFMDMYADLSGLQAPEKNPASARGNSSRLGIETVKAVKVLC